MSQFVSSRLTQADSLCSFPKDQHRAILCEIFAPNSLQSCVISKHYLTVRDPSRRCTHYSFSPVACSIDPQVFDIAQIRFQNASSAPAYVTRMPDLVQAAVLYTNITALLCFPTYPIDAVKLAVFALAFTPGPLGQILLRSSPEFAQQQQYSRLSGSDMEKLMKDLTAVRDITRGGSVGISEGELRDWHEWLRELTLDWRSLDPL